MKVKSLSYLFVVFVTGVCLLTFNACASPQAHMVVKAVDADTGDVIVGANVKVAYESSTSKAPGTGWGTVTVPDHKKGHTNRDGVFDSKGKTEDSPRISVDCDGYYQSRTSYGKYIDDKGYLKNSKIEVFSVNKVLNRWEPWPCEVTVKLKKIKDSVSMCVKSTDWLNVPEVGSSVGFDLEVGDWVAPHGKGKVSDFIFNLTARFKSPFDSEAKYEMTFSDPLDGIQEFKADPKDQSVFKYPYQAPETGYINEMSRYEFNDRTSDGENVYKTDMKEKREYLYRVRTKTDALGNIISANYGYLTSELSVQRFKGGRIKFRYYFNSDNQSRSLEYSGVNLFEDRDVQGRIK